MTAPLDFVPLWTLILGFGVFMYVLMDGFDLGVGILFRHAPGDAARDLIMNSVAPIWDGNETWLVPRRACSACRLSTRLRHYHASSLFPDPHHGGSAHLPRHRF